MNGILPNKSYSLIPGCTRRVVLAALAMFCAVCGYAQTTVTQGQYDKAKLDISRLTALEEKAESVAEVNVDRKTLRLAEKFLKGTDPDEARIKELIRGIEGIWVKVFEFEKEGQFNPQEFDSVRAQLKNPGWVRLAGVRSLRKEKMEVEVSIMTDDNDNLLGLAIVASEPKQLVVVNIVGNFDPAKIRELSGKFKIPDLDLEGIGVVKKKVKDKSGESKDKEKN